jgi:hypothetical protein
VAARKAGKSFAEFRLKSRCFEVNGRGTKAVFDGGTRRDCVADVDLTGNVGVRGKSSCEFNLKDLMSASGLEGIVVVSDGGIGNDFLANFNLTGVIGVKEVKSSREFNPKT